MRPLVLHSNIDVPQRIDLPTRRDLRRRGLEENQVSKLRTAARCPTTRPQFRPISDPAFPSTRSTTHLATNRSAVNVALNTPSIVSNTSPSLRVISDT